jgi:hypothetical protein
VHSSNVADASGLPTLQRYLAGNDAISVRVVTDDPAPGPAALPPRSYTSLKAVTAEVGDSRWACITLWNRWVDNECAATHGVTYS